MGHEHYEDSDTLLSINPEAKALIIFIRHPEVRCNLKAHIVCAVFSMSLLKLPIGIQAFSEMRTGGYAYVDKTWFISDLVAKGKYYFLSRPRRFGKSLFIDTLDCAFSGRKEMFSGLYLNSPEAGWDFNTIFPVLRIDFAGGMMR